MPLNSFNKTVVFTLFVFSEGYKVAKNQAFVFPEEYKIVDNRVFVFPEEYKVVKNQAFVFPEEYKVAAFCRTGNGHIYSVCKTGIAE